MDSKEQSRFIGEVTSLTDTLRSTIGPYGARKLVVEESGKVTVTSSCASILDRIRLENPAVTVFDRTARGFTETHGDGVTRLIVLTGALLEAAETLSSQGLRPSAIEQGFREACSAAMEQISESERPLSEEGASAVIHTALTDVRDQSTRNYFSSVLGEVVDELEASTEEFDARDLTVSTRIGAGQAESELVHGVVLDRPPAVEEMPRSLGTTGVAIISETVDVPKLGGATARGDKRYSLESSSLEEKRSFAERERAAFQGQLDDVLELGCRVIVTKKAINERIEMLLANHGVLAIQRVEDDDFRRLARTTGATVVPGLDEVTAETLGQGKVNVTREGGRDMTVVESTGSAPVYTLFCRSPDHRSLDALERSMESAIASVHSSRKTKTVVPGGGAIEMAASRTVKRQSRSVDGAGQVAMAEFGRALTAVPRTLAATTGIDSTDALVNLRTAHAKGQNTVGVDCVLGETTDVLMAEHQPIVDPASLTRDIWSAATDLAVQLVRIDDVVAASDLGDGETNGAGLDGDDVLRP